MHGVKSGEKQSRDSKGLFQVKSHRMCLIPPAKMCENNYERSMMGAHWDSAPRVFIGANHIGSLCLHIFSLNHLFVQFWHHKPLLSVLGIMRTFLKSKFPDANQGQPCKQLFQSTVVRPAMLCPPWPMVLKYISMPFSPGRSHPNK